MTGLLKVFGLALIAGLVWWLLSADGPFAAKTTVMASRAGPAQPPRGQRLQTAHYLIQSSASAEETRLVGERVEGLHTAFVRFFGAEIRLQPKTPLQLYLYGTRREFKINNRSRSWAEAYYLRPVCHAYFGRGEASPYHWMIHEATHQLSRELAGFPRKRWVDEGLASYFGTSRFVDGTLRLGTIDPNTYPVWWSGRGPTGDVAEDIKAGKFIPLRVLITDEGKEGIAANVNGYYLAYWNLAHFLLDAEGGRRAAGFRKVIVEGGSVESFERNIGPIDEVEKQWYAYFVALPRSEPEIDVLP